MPAAPEHPRCLRRCPALPWVPEPENARSLLVASSDSLGWNRARFAGKSALGSTRLVRRPTLGTRQFPPLRASVPAVFLQGARLNSGPTSKPNGRWGRAMRSRRAFRVATAGRAARVKATTGRIAQCREAILVPRKKIQKNATRFVIPHPLSANSLWMSVFLPQHSCVYRRRRGTVGKDHFPDLYAHQCSYKLLQRWPGAQGFHPKGTDNHAYGSGSAFHQQGICGTAAPDAVDSSERPLLRVLAARPVALTLRTSEGRHGVPLSPQS